VSIDPKRHDDLQPELRDLYRRMRDAKVAPLAVAGGHGLFLKQRWLFEQGIEDIVVPLARWRNPNPRATKDFDVVVECAFLADRKKQAVIVAVLKECEFEVTETNPRWQFEKELSPGRKIILELHAETPGVDLPQLKVSGPRVKHKSALGDAAVHGRHNPEAIGCDLHPFLVPDEGLEIPVPNVITWAIMKLTAMDDRYARSQDGTLNAETRSFNSSEAGKHASDVCRIVAMASRKEVDDASEVAARIRKEPAFVRAAQIVREHFLPDHGIGVMLTEGQWEADDHRQIRDLVGAWFEED